MIVFSNWPSGRMRQTYKIEGFPPIKHVTTQCSISMVRSKSYND